ncbi:hypothetical protein F5H01DRAFT_339625 [Linnemannia elongata]|nr:hypothetical protein F5H01DRAFT_339625 [Linnemannia elongata]
MNLTLVRPWLLTINCQQARARATDEEPESCHILLNKCTGTSFASSVKTSAESPLCAEWRYPKMTNDFNCVTTLAWRRRPTDQLS